jgi:hypothetical protein
MKKYTIIEPNKGKFKKCDILQFIICVRKCEYLPRELKSLAKSLGACMYVRTWFVLSVESITRPNIRTVQ